MSVDILLSPKYAAGLRALIIPKYGKINLADNLVFTPPGNAKGGRTGISYPTSGAALILGASVSQAASEDFTCAFLIDAANPAISNGGVFRTSTGADNFVVLQATSGQSYPWVRLAGSNVLQPASGPKTPSKRPFLGVVTVRSGKSVEFTLDGVTIHRATTAVNTGAGTFSNIGQQGGESIGDFSAIAYWARYIDPVDLSIDILKQAKSGANFFFADSAATGSTVTCTVGNASAAGSSAIISRSIAASVGNTTAAGTSANVGSSIVATVGNATASGVSALLNASVVAAVGNATAAGAQATISAGGSATITCSVGNASAAASTALVGRSVVCAVGNSSAAGATATISTGSATTVTCSVGTASASAPDSLISKSVLCSIGSATAAGTYASIIASGPTVVVCSVGSAWASGPTCVVNGGQPLASRGSSGRYRETTQQTTRPRNLQWTSRTNIQG